LALNQEVRNIQKRQDQFAGEADTLLQDIQAFRGQSGWNELVPILKSTRKVRGVKRPADAAKGQAAALKAWGDKWDQSPDTVFQRYQQLVERSSTIENRRKALVEAWTNLRTQEEARIRSSGTFKAKDINTVVANETMNYEMNRANLNLFGLDELGLFTRTPQ
jgi:hypothetical protein